MKKQLLPVILLVALFTLGLTSVALAQGEVPSPYAGVKNPFPWDNTSAQEAGKKLYQQSCLGCHGDKGTNLATANFGITEYAKNLEAGPDYAFWILSEGRLDKGMPPFKSSLSEEKRWQVLTYLWSLGKEAPAKEPSPAVETNGNLRLVVPQEAQAGELLTLKAVLHDDQGNPVADATVKFYLRMDFFANALMEIGEVTTDNAGVALLEYQPRGDGKITLVARNNTTETTATLTLAEAGEPFYQAKAGIKLPTTGKEVFIGPPSALELGEMGEAPTSAFRLPGSILSWLLLMVVTVGLIWFSYFRVIHYVLRIANVQQSSTVNTRLVPLVGLSFVLILGIMLVLKLLTGPYSHFHLPH